MKTMKKLLALLLALGLVFALTACGNGDSESSQTPSENVTESQEPPHPMRAAPPATTASSPPLRRANSSCPPTPPSLPMR